jgi:hypothetical protein
MTMRIRREPYPGDWVSWLFGPLICCVFVAIIGSSGGYWWAWLFPAAWVSSFLVAWWKWPRLRFDDAGFSLHPKLVWGSRRDFHWTDVKAWGREEYLRGHAGEDSYAEVRYERLAVYLHDGRALRYQDAFFSILEEELRTTIGPPLPIRGVDPAEAVQ